MNTFSLTPRLPALYRRLHYQQWRIAMLVLGLCIAVGSGCGTPQTALAQDERVTVRLDGRALFRVGIGSDVDAATRARRIEGRLETLLANPQAIVPAQVEPSDANVEERLVTIAGVPIVTVTESDAQDNLTSIDALAALWAQRIDEALTRAGERRDSPWGRFITEVQASIETAFARLLESAIVIIPRALAALLVLGLFWLIAVVVRRLMHVLFWRIVPDPTVQNLIRQLSYYALWSLGLLVAVDAFGFDPQTVITGLGLTGLALGFALKDIISNFVSGLLILTLRPFQLGDQIVVGDTEGSVDRVTLRATQIRTYDGRLVIVPNAELFTSRVTNNTASPVRRGSVSVILSYQTDLERASAVMGEATRKTSGVLVDPPVLVRLQEFRSNEVIVEVRFWTDSRRADFLATASAVRYAVLRELQQAQIPLPDPTQQIVSLKSEPVRA